jgi:hypothetical protein
VLFLLYLQLLKLPLKFNRLGMIGCRAMMLLMLLAWWSRIHILG